MSFEALKKEIDLLGDVERRRLLAYLVSVEDAKTTANAERMREKIDDNSPGRWLTLEQLDEKLGLNSDKP